jgi:hypothetical protein
MRRPDHKLILTGRVGKMDSDPLSAGAQPNELTQRLEVDVRPDRKDDAGPQLPTQPSACTPDDESASSPAVAIAVNNPSSDLMMNPSMF